MQKGGFMKTAVVFIGVIVAIIYFDINVREIVESDTVQSIIAFAKSMYANYIKPLIIWVDGLIPDTIKDIFSRSTTAQ